LFEDSFSNTNDTSGFSFSGCYKNTENCGYSVASRGRPIRAKVLFAGEEHCKGGKYLKTKRSLLSS
jgi:hypothetical protein